MIADPLPLVSILLVTWNRKYDLKKAIESALAQSYTAIEIVVVDNDSTDDTAALVATEFPMVRLVPAPRNLGCPSGRNYGFGFCRGKYVYLLDDDGWLEPDAVRLTVESAEADDTLGVIMSRIHVVEHSEVAYKWPHGQESPVYLNSFVGCCALLRKDIIDLVGGFPDDFWRQSEEEDMTLRMMDRGFYCLLEPASVMYHAHSEVGRNQRDFLYYSLRNTNKTALRHWPFPWYALRLLRNMGHAVAGALTMRAFSLPFVLFKDCLLDLLRLPGMRKPVSPQTLHTYRQLAAHPTLDLSPEERERAARARAACVFPPAATPPEACRR